MGQVWDLELPAAKLLVLLAMTDHADHNGENIFPSVELVAWKTGYSESQARRIMKSLVKDGILEAQPRPGKTTVYAVHLENGKQKEPFKRLNTGYQNDTPAIAMTPQGLQSYDTPTPAIAMTPEPSLEPSSNRIAPKPNTKTSSITLDKQDALIQIWARLRKLDALDLGATLTTENRRKVARKMLTWARPPSEDEIGEAIRLSKSKDYEFTWLESDIPKIRATKIPKVEAELPDSVALNAAAFKEGA